MQRPIEFEIKQTVPLRKVSDDKIREVYRKRCPQEAGAMAIQHTLGPDGYALVLRLLCTLACGEPSECPGYADQAVAQIKSLLPRRDHRSSESSIKSFLSTGIVELLANGTFRLKDDGLVQAVASLVTALLDGDKQAGYDFQQRIAQGWRVTDARDGAMRRICELALDRTLRARIAADDVTTVNQIVGTYFIADIPNVRRETTEQVMTRLGGVTWNL